MPMLFVYKFLSYAMQVYAFTSLTKSHSGPVTRKSVKYLAMKKKQNKIFSSNSKEIIKKRLCNWTITQNKCLIFWCVLIYSIIYY